MFKKHYIAKSTVEEDILDKCKEMNNTYKNRHFEVERGESYIMYDGRLGYIWWLVEVKYF